MTDYTEEIISFLQDFHGCTQLDSTGNYVYDNVSAVSLRFLLTTKLPKKEILWHWYDHFENSYGETLHTRLGPERDSELLQILDNCDFKFDRQKLINSGLLFLDEHQSQVYSLLTDFYSQRLDELSASSTADLYEMLDNPDTYTDRHIETLTKNILVVPLAQHERDDIYQQMASDYLKASATLIMRKFHKEAYWSKLPHSLGTLQAAVRATRDYLHRMAIALDIYISKKSTRQARFGRTGSASFARRQYSGDLQYETSCSVLGVTPNASVSTIKARYRKVAKRYHPDQGGDPQLFMQIQKAYEYLLKEETRYEGTTR